MRVKSLKYPNILVTTQDGKAYSFKDGYCDIPDGEALNLTQINPDYILADDEGGAKRSPSERYPFNPATWQPEQKRLIWDGPVGYNNGYGKASMMIVEGLDKLVDLYMVNGKWIGSTTKHISENLERIMAKELPALDSYYVKFFPAFEFTRRLAERYIGYTMLEATRIPKSWVDNCNEYCERIIVPCQQQKQAFIDSGVKRDIEVIPLGLIPDQFPLLEREEDDGVFMFGTMGTLTYRKGTDLLVKAFKQGFPKEKYPNVGLYIKTLASKAGFTNMWFMGAQDLLQDDRVVMVTESFSPEELIQEFFAKVDCFVFPTRGEGFGLPPLEAMATGLPVICTPFSGTEEFINDKVAYPIAYKMVDVPNGTAGGYPEELQAEGQQWAEPDLDSLIAQMHEVYNNRGEAKKKGKKAAKFVRDNFTVEHTAQKLVNYLDRKF